ncbi:MAG: hypothetical protein E7505_01740 [Ruminococcus sp.]|nr:hypothetical protein [Ruminococcus sp.]
MNILKIFLRTAVVVSLMIYPLFLNLLAGTALITGAYNNFEQLIIGEAAYHRYLAMGIAMLLSSALITAAVVLCFIHKKIPAVVLGWSGFFICLAVTLVLRKTALLNGLSDADLVPYADIYMSRHLPTVFCPVLLTVLSIVSCISEKDSLSGAKKKRSG